MRRQIIREREKEGRREREIEREREGVRDKERAREGNNQSREYRNVGEKKIRKKCKLKRWIVRGRVGWEEKKERKSQEEQKERKLKEEKWEGEKIIEEDKEEGE